MSPESIIVFMIRIATVIHDDTRGRRLVSPLPLSLSREGDIDYYPPTHRVHLLDNYNLVGGILLKRTGDSERTKPLVA